MTETGASGSPPSSGFANSTPAVSVVIPCRNEKQHIAACIRSMLCQEPPDGGVEVIVADGMSDDGTAEILTGLLREHPAIRVVENPGRIVSTGLNRAIEAARGHIIIRVDAHTEYASDYIRQCVGVLHATRADNVGGPWIAAPRGYMGSAIAAAFHSKFGSGGALAHDPHYEGPVDTVYLGCWHRETLVRLGGFDEELVRNQDDELNLRLRRRGGTIWQSPHIKSRYHPRNSLRLLFRQYMQYGYWKVRVIQKHRLPASWRHLVPGLFVLAIVALGIASPVSTIAAAGLAILTGVYAAGTLAASLMTARQSDLNLLPALPAVFFCLHVGYGCGFLMGIVDFAGLRRAHAARMAEITREPVDTQMEYSGATSKVKAPNQT